MRRIGVVFSILAIILLSAGATWGQEALAPMAIGEELTLEACIALTLKQHPAQAAARADAEAASARVGQARAAYLPQVKLEGSYSDNRSTTFFTGASSRTEGWQGKFSGTQLLFDFGKTPSTIEAAKADLAAYEQASARVRQQLILQVREAYFGLLAAERLIRVHEETVAQTEARLKQAEAFFEVGTRPRFDVTQAEVEVNNSRLNLIKARHAVRVAQATLANRIGIDPSTPVRVRDVPERREAVDLAQSVQEALRRRPEVLEAEERVRQTESLVAATQADYYPAISLQGSYLFNGVTYRSGSTEVPQGDSWGGGVVLTYNLFDGFLTRNKVSEQRALLRGLRDRLEETRLNVRLEVRQAWLALQDAAARLDVVRSNVKKARENFEIAQGRYEAGVGVLLEVNDARVALTAAETEAVTALYDYQTALARLEKAMGRESITVSSKQ